MKKYGLFFICCLLGYCVNAFAVDVSDKRNIEITTQDAYALLKGYYGGSRDIVKYTQLISFMEGAKYFAVVHNKANGNDESIEKCISLPLMVFADKAFKDFENGKEDGKSIFLAKFLGEIEKCFQSN